MGWVGLDFFNPPWWVGSKNSLNLTQFDPCIPLSHSLSLNVAMMTLLLNIDWNLQVLTDSICINACDAEYIFTDDTNSILNDILPQFLFISRFLV